MTRGNLPTIDVHAHALLPVWISALAKATGQTAGSVKFADAPCRTGPSKAIFA